MLGVWCRIYIGLFCYFIVFRLLGVMLLMLILIGEFIVLVCLLGVKLVMNGMVILIVVMFLSVVVSCR